VITIDIGFFETDKYPGGTPLSLVAAVHELGYPDKGIPSRPFMRTAYKDNKEDWNSLAGELFTQVAAGKMGWDNALNQIGLVIVGDIKQSITDNTFEPLAGPTIAARARRSKNHTDKPFVGPTIAARARRSKNHTDKPFVGPIIAARARRSENHTDKPLIDTSRMLTSIKHKVNV